MDQQTKNLYEAKAKIFKALAHPSRLWMVEQLKDGEQCVCEFVKVINADFSTISKHLSVLKQAGIVVDRKEGKKVFYQLKVPCILNFMGCINSVITQQIEEQMILLQNTK